MHELEEAILRIFNEGAGSYRLGRGFDGAIEVIVHKHPEPKPSKPRVAEAISSLVSRGLLYVDFSANEGRAREKPVPPEDWSVALTARGQAAAGDTTINPDMPEGYLEQFARDIPQAPDIVQRYVKEAIDTYTQRCYMACAVMLGVAAEAVFLDMAESFVKWLPAKEGETYRKLLDNPRTTYNTLFEGYRKQLEMRRKELPPRLGDNIDIQIDSVLNMIRQYRNDAGHPTGTMMDRGSCYTSLVMFAVAARRLYALKVFFDSNSK